MKKFILLMGTFGLAACGGGSDGGSGAVIGPDGYIVRIPQVSDAVRENNREVTTMASEVLVPTDGTNDVVVRSASGGVLMDGLDYLSYRLDDVSFQTTGAYAAEMSFVLNPDGQITGLNVGGVIYGRVGDSNVFEAENGQKVQYSSFGKNLNSGGLHYADFGLIKFNPTVGELVDSSAHDMAFVGGYDAATMDKKQFDTELTFNGRARGRVGDISLADDSATLTFDPASGNETFAASFSNWYDMRVVRDANDTVTLTLNDTNNSITDGALQTPTQMQNNTQTTTEGINFQSRYFGAPTGTAAVEATATLEYYQGIGPNRTNVNIGFGGATAQ